MKITLNKTHILFIVVVVALLTTILYFAVPAVKLALNSIGTPIIAAIASGIVSIQQQPWWKLYVTPYAFYYGIGIGMVAMALIWKGFITMRQWFVKTTYKEMGFQGAPSYTPQVIPTTEPAKQPQSVPVPAPAPAPAPEVKPEEPAA